MKYSINEIAECTQGQLIRSGVSDNISQICLDSRKVFLASESVFFAISGNNHDGHLFLPELYKKGVRAFVVEYGEYSESLPEAAIIVVKNSLDALQKLTAAHRSKFHIPVIGITGSNGKTVVKEWLNVMLADEYSIVRSPRSYNSQTGVPLSVWNLDEGHDLALFEAGVSLPGEMEKLERIIRPDIGVFINVGNAHLENFESGQQLADEKAKLFEHCKVLITSADYEEMNRAVQKLDLTSTQHITWSMKGDADLKLIGRNTTVDLTILRCTWKDVECSFDLHFTDEASIENAMCCIAVLFQLGYDATRIQLLLQRLAPIAMRLEVISGSGNSVIVNDSYNSDIHSLEIALDFLAQQAHGKSKIVVISDIEQSGWPADRLHTRVNELMLSKGIDRIIGIGAGMVENTSRYSIDITAYPDTDSFLKNIKQESLYNKAILVKGARNFRFERVVYALQEQSHDTVLEINLNALSHNLNYFRSKLKPGVKLMVMVKAFGYGSGAQEVAGLLEFNKIDYLAVAYVDEGVALREAGISLPIMVMNAERASLDTLIRYRLEPEIYSFRSFSNFQDALFRANYEGRYPIHIKCDTGMHRLGFVAEDLDKLKDELSKSSSAKVVSVFTHLAAADEPKHDEFTANQLLQFDNFCFELEKSLDHSFIKHTSNTAAIQRFPDAQYDMVRLGIGLYGVAAYAEDQQRLQPVGKLKTVISQIKHIKKGESIGYGRSYIASKEMTTATIPLGYADGLRRSLSNGVGEVIIHGKRCPIVGRVCMDMMMIDISHINASEGDEVIIFGTDISLIELAEKSGTIAYELLTSISSRVKRVYLSE